MRAEFARLSKSEPLTWRGEYVTLRAISATGFGLSTEFSGSDGEFRRPESRFSAGSFAVAVRRDGRLAGRSPGQAPVPEQPLRAPAKGEYRYMDLGDENYQVPTLGGGGTDVGLDIHTVRFGINYRF